jgi:hypothetical protein
LLAAVLLANDEQYQLSLTYCPKDKTCSVTATLRQYPLPRERFQYCHAEGAGIADFHHRFSQIEEYPKGKYLALKRNGRLVFILPGVYPPRWVRSLSSFASRSQYYSRAGRYRYPLMQKFPIRERITHIYNYQGCFILVGVSGMLYLMGRKHPALSLFPHATAK